MEFRHARSLTARNEKLSNKLVDRSRRQQITHRIDEKSLHRSTATHNPEFLKKNSTLQYKSRAKCRKICKAIVSSSVRYQCSIKNPIVLRSTELNQDEKNEPKLKTFFRAWWKIICVRVRRSDGEFSQRMQDRHREGGRERKYAPQWLNFWHRISFAISLALVFGINSNNKKQ